MYRLHVPQDGIVPQISRLQVQITWHPSLAARGACECSAYLAVTHATKPKGAHPSAQHARASSSSSNSSCERRSSGAQTSGAQAAATVPLIWGPVVASAARAAQSAAAAFKCRRPPQRARQTTRTRHESTTTPQPPSGSVDTDEHSLVPMYKVRLVIATLHAMAQLAGASNRPRDLARRWWLCCPCCPCALAAHRARRTRRACIEPPHTQPRARTSVGRCFQ